MKRFFGLAAFLAILGTAAISNAAIFTFVANMDGPSEEPPVPESSGTGFAQVDYDDVAHTLRVQANFTGLEGTTSAAHIHGPTDDPPPLGLGQTAGVITQTPFFEDFPIGVMSGSYDHTFDLTDAASWNAAFISANGGTPATAETAFAGFLAEGRTYFNIHTSFRGGGEIRGFLVVPEPASLGLFAAGAVAVIIGGRRVTRRRSTTM